MSARDAIPGIEREFRILREAALEGMPILGICLGAQLAARALGAAIFASPMKEIGWRSISPTQSGKTDPLFLHLSDEQIVFQLHEEAFDVPPDAERMAMSAGCPNQGFRWGKRVYGVQFHPEATPETIELWIREEAGCGAGSELPSPDEAHFALEERGRLAQTFMKEWLKLL